MHGLTVIIWSFLCFVTQSTAQDCSQDQAKCNPACVAVERVVNRYGASASSSVLMAVPRFTNNYILCHSRPISTKSKSQIFCVYGAMDDLQAAQTQFVVLADGVVTNFEAFAVGTKQYVVIFAMNRNPILYEVTIKDHTLVSFHALRLIGGQGALDMAVAQSVETTLLVASSGRQCRDGDQQCINPTVSLIDQKATTITQCSTATAGPAEYVAAWSVGNDHFLVLASLVPGDAFVYRMTLHQLVKVATGECGLMPVEDVTFGRAVCGIQSMEAITGIGGTGMVALMVASRPCPGMIDGVPQASNEKVNALYLLWDPNTQKFFRVADELPETNGVSKITQISDQFFLCQKTSEPSTIHVSDVLPEPLANSLVSTVRVNNQASISAVQSANRDTYLTHVTSSGSVVIDWVSCTKNQLLKPSNFTLSQYSGNAYLTGSANLTEADEISDNFLYPNRQRSHLRRPDRDTPVAMHHETQSVPRDLSLNATSNITDLPFMTGPLRYEDMLMDRHLEEPRLDFHDPHGLGMQRPGPELMAPQPVFHQEFYPPPPMNQPPPQNGMGQPSNWMQGMGMHIMGPNGQPMPVVPVMGHNGPFYGGGPQQQVPPGSAFAGYITFPPVAVFSPVPSVYQMPPNAQMPGGPQNAEQPQFQPQGPPFPQQPPFWTPEPRPQAPLPQPRPWEQQYSRGIPNGIPYHHGHHGGMINMGARPMSLHPNQTNMQQPTWPVLGQWLPPTPVPTVFNVSDTNSTTVSSTWTIPSETSTSTGATLRGTVEVAVTEAVPAVSHTDVATVETTLNMESTTETTSQSVSESSTEMSTSTLALESST